MMRTFYTWVGLPVPVLLIVALPLLFSVHAEAEQGGDGARQLFERGQEHERSGNLASALEDYQHAEELRPSFRLHRHIGRVLRGLGRYNEAHHRFERFLEEGGERITEEQRQWVTQTNDEIQRLIATLQVLAPDGAEVLLDGTSVGRSPIAEPLSLDPGRHAVEVRLEGHRDVRREFDLEGGEVRTLEILLSSFARVDDDATSPPIEPDGVGDPLDTGDEEDSGGATAPVPDDAQRPSVSGRRRRVHRALFYSVLGLSAAALTGGVVLGALTSREHDDFDRLNVPNRTNAEESALIESGNRGESFALSADVMIFTGAALAVATLIMGFFTDFDRTAEDDSNLGGVQ